MSNDKFGEDKPEYTLNTQKLNQTFGIQSGKSQEVMESQVKEMRDILDDQTKELENNKNQISPDDILYKNVERANNLLDKLEEQMGTGQLEPRMFEVAGQLINAITTASSSIVGVEQHQEDLQYKYDWLEHKNKELQVKQALKDGKSSDNQGTTNNNLIVTSREDILDMINKEEGGEKEIENNSEEEE